MLFAEYSEIKCIFGFLLGEIYGINLATYFKNQDCFGHFTYLRFTIEADILTVLSPAPPFFLIDDISLFTK